MDKQINNNKSQDRKKVLTDLMKNKKYVPMKAKELAIFLNVSKEDRKELQDVLNEMLKEGTISISKKGKYGINVNPLLTGTFEATNKGFGFVVTEESEEDIFIPASAVNGAFPKDIVQFAVVDRHKGRRKEGKIVKIIEHVFTEVVGTYEKNKSFGFVVPDNTKIPKDIYVSEKDSMGAVDGHKVVVRITDYGSNTRKPEGEVIEIIGHKNDPGTDIISIIKSYGIPTEYPEEVMQQIEAIPDEIDTEKYLNQRIDIRDWQTVTIDGEDAKDLDDAITLEKVDNGYKLGVHIADVSEYVTENSPLDKEAKKRGTSVYLVDRVIPMIPHKLSNGICSLNAGVDRLALSCIMNIDYNGNVLSHKMAETIIKVDRRMTYTSVKKVLDGDVEEIEEYKDLVPMFRCMFELSKILRDKRYKRGSINFDFPESKITLDERGKPIEVKAYERSSANEIIEDFMLLANETVAEDYYWQEIPFVYRNHDKPEEEKIIKFGTFINNFGYSIKMPNGEVHPKELQKLLKKIENTPEEALISRLMLRSMKRASYTTESTGHFGLSAKYYSHFTSPIRRYPDLQIHRIIKENLRGKMTEKRIEHYNKILNEVSAGCSTTERRADEVEREVDKLKKVEFMEDKIGHVFEGIISGLTEWGIYVELPNTVEGMIRISEIKGDTYKFDEEHMEVYGERTRKVFKLGQNVTVILTRTDRAVKTIDFELY